MKRPLWFETQSNRFLSQDPPSTQYQMDNRIPGSLSTIANKHVYSHGSCTLFRRRIGGQRFTVLWWSLHHFFRTSSALGKQHRALVVAVPEFLEPDLRLLIGGVQLQRLFLTSPPLLLSGSSRWPSRTAGDRSSTRPCCAMSRGARSRSYCCPETAPAPPHTR